MVAERETRLRSYLLWEAAGRPQGRDLEFWLRAEADLRSEAEAGARSPSRPRLTLVPGIPFFSLPPHRSIAMRFHRENPNPRLTLPDDKRQF